MQVLYIYLVVVYFKYKPANVVKTTRLLLTEFLELGENNYLKILLNLINNVPYS